LGGRNLYGFCGNDPINYFDYMGLATTPDEWFVNSDDRPGNIRAATEGFRFAVPYMAPYAVGMIAGAVTFELAGPVLASWLGRGALSAWAAGTLSGGYADLATQGTQMALGYRKEYNPNQTAIVAGGGGLLTLGTYYIAPAAARLLFPQLQKVINSESCSSPTTSPVGTISADASLSPGKGFAAERTVGDILAGHSPDTMIHLTTATEQELATATFPNFTPPHTTPGVFQGSSWARLGDVSHMTLAEYQELVVGPSAAGYGSGVSAFLTHPPSSVFTPVNVPNLGGVQEFINGTVVKPGTYVPLPLKQ
jgi:hypothetical protein